MSTAAIAYGRKIARSLKILVVCSRVCKKTAGNYEYLSVSKRSGQPESSAVSLVQLIPNISAEVPAIQCLMPTAATHDIEGTELSHRAAKTSKQEMKNLMTLVTYLTLGDVHHIFKQVSRPILLFRS